MRMLQRILFVALAVTAVATPASSQEASGVRFFLKGGLQDLPSKEDAGRTVSYDQAPRLGGGAAIQLRDNLWFRAEVAIVTHTGFETAMDTTGATPVESLAEDVEFRRDYFGVGLEFQIPTTTALTPYVTLGGGLIHFERSADYTSYGFSEPTGNLGAGFSLPLGTPALTASVEGAIWTWSNTAIDGRWEFDPVLSVGLGYAFSL